MCYIIPEISYTIHMFLIERVKSAGMQFNKRMRELAGKLQKISKIKTLLQLWMLQQERVGNKLIVMSQ